MEEEEEEGWQELTWKHKTSRKVYMVQEILSNSKLVLPDTAGRIIRAGIKQKNYTANRLKAKFDNATIILM